MAINGGNPSPPNNGDGEGQTWRCNRCGMTTEDVAHHFREECPEVSDADY